MRRFLVTSLLFICAAAPSGAADFVHRAQSFFFGGSGERVPNEVEIEIFITKSLAVWDEGPYTLEFAWSPEGAVPRSLKHGKAVLEIVVDRREGSVQSLVLRRKAGRGGFGLDACGALEEPLEAGDLITFTLKLKKPPKLSSDAWLMVEGAISDRLPEEMGGSWYMDCAAYELSLE